MPSRCASSKSGFVRARRHLRSRRTRRSRPASSKYQRGKKVVSASSGYTTRLDAEAVRARAAARAGAPPRARALVAARDRPELRGHRRPDRLRHDDLRSVATSRQACQRREQRLRGARRRRPRGRRGSVFSAGLWLDAADATGRRSSPPGRPGRASGHRDPRPTACGAPCGRASRPSARPAPRSRSSNSTGSKRASRARRDRRRPRRAASSSRNTCRAARSASRSVALVGVAQVDGQRGRSARPR